jgi:hypothetical protein
MAAKETARLRFWRMGAPAGAGPDERGEVVLNGDGTYTLSPSPDLRVRLLRAAERMDAGALFWGASLFMGLMVGGGLLVAKGRRGLGFALVGGAGASALGGAAARRGAQTLTALLDTRRPVSELSVTAEAEGELALHLSPVPWATDLFRFGPGEFDPEEARAFADALRAAKR